VEDLTKDKKVLCRNARITVCSPCMTCASRGGHFVSFWP